MQRQKLYEQVLRLLKRREMTVQQIVQSTGADASNTYKAVLIARREGKIHISGWTYQHNPEASHRHFTTVQVYGYGPGPDVPKPKPGPRRRRAKIVRKEPAAAVPEAQARLAREEQITQGVLAATRAVLTRDPGNFFASMLGQMGAV